MQVENVVLSINKAGGRLNFQRTFNDGDGDTGRSPTMTLNAVTGAGVFQFQIVSGDTTSRNQWRKLAVNQYATFRNSNPNDTGGGVVNDRALGSALASYLANAITLNGGTLQGSNASLNYNISANRGITLGALGGTLQRSWTVDSVITGPGGLTLSLGGTTTLNAVNTYEGDTVVNDATLAVTGGNAIPDTSTLRINTGGKVDPSGTTETVSALFFGTEQQAAGTWGATGSGAANINNTYFTGSGVVNVVPFVANDFAAWAASQSPPVTGGPNGDDDHDGVKNLIEYALADGQERGTLTGLTLSYTKRGAPWGSDITYAIETSEDLGISDQWQPATPDTNDPSTISYTLQNPGDNFARLKVSQN
jgi:hypothetical protein